MYRLNSIDDSMIMYGDWQCVCYVACVVLWSYDVLECGLIMYVELVYLDDIWCIVFFLFGLNIIWIVIWLGRVSWNDMDAYMFFLALLVLDCDMNVYAWAVLMLMQFEWYVICCMLWCGLLCVCCDVECYVYVVCCDECVCFEYVCYDVDCYVELSWWWFCLDCVHARCSDAITDFLLFNFCLLWYVIYGMVCLVMKFELPRFLSRTLILFLCRMTYWAQLDMALMYVHAIGFGCVQVCWQGVLAWHKLGVKSWFVAQVWSYMDMKYTLLYMKETWSNDHEYWWNGGSSWTWRWRGRFLGSEVWLWSNVWPKVNYWSNLM